MIAGLVRLVLTTGSVGCALHDWSLCFRSGIVVPEGWTHLWLGRRASAHCGPAFLQQGHFLLVQLLLPLLEASAPSRVVVTSSCYHDVANGRKATIAFDDLDWQTRRYDGWAAYGQSKLANVLHAKARGLGCRLIVLSWHWRGSSAVVAQ